MVIHESHKIVVYKGVVYCEVCSASVEIKFQIPCGAIFYSPPELN